MSYRKCQRQACCILIVYATLEARYWWSCMPMVNYYVDVYILLCTYHCAQAKHSNNNPRQELFIVSMLLFDFRWTQSSIHSEVAAERYRCAILYDRQYWIYYYYYPPCRYTTCIINSVLDPAPTSAHYTHDTPNGNVLEHQLVNETYN